MASRPSWGGEARCTQGWGRLLPSSPLPPASPLGAPAPFGADLPGRAVESPDQALAQMGLWVWRICFYGGGRDCRPRGGGLGEGSTC